MWSLLKLAIPGWGMYAVLIAAAVGIWGHGYFYGWSAGKEGETNLRISFAAQAAEQEANTRSTIKAHQKLKEAIDEKAKLQKEADALKLADADRRVRELTRSNSRLLSSRSGSPFSNQRVCASSDTLDSEISGAINRVVERHATRNLQLAEEGSRAVNVAILCQQWAKGFQ